MEPTKQPKPQVDVNKLEASKAEKAQIANNGNIVIKDTDEKG